MKGLMIMFPAFVLFAVPGAPAQEASSRANEAGDIKMMAKRYGFDPNPIRVKKGDHVKLVITAVDHDHGFKLEAFHIEQLLKKGEATTVEFTADQAGTFPFACSHFCGMGHKKMTGELVVE
ncbi:MAG TPA: cupredoxin domain-containing protein [Bryobacteraceae bacterium]|nr:cupredoxin domain-containing protein [Bryobacteraceae bacterium]